MKVYKILLSVLLIMGLLLLIGCPQESSSDSNNSPSKEASGDQADWESWQTIYITEGKGTTVTNVSVSTPWNTVLPQNAFGTDIATDIKKSDGWNLILNTCAKDGYGPGRNYLIFYNHLLGIMRVFYYCDKEITGTGNEHFWEVTMGTKSDRSSYYGQLPFTIPYSQSINPAISGGTFQTANIFNQLVTNYQTGSNKTLAHDSWNCFDLDMSAYSETKFKDANDQITFRLLATTKQEVTLASTLSAKLTGNIDIDKINQPASSGKGIFDTISSLKDYGSKIWDVGKAVYGVVTGNDILDNINKIAGAIPGLITSTKGYINMFDSTPSQTEPTYTPTYRGSLNVNLNGSINTSGYIQQNGDTTDIPAFTISSANITDDKLGEGIWNLKDTPVIMQFPNLSYNTDMSKVASCKFSMVMMDPESVTLMLRDDIRQAAQNIQLETVWGYIENDSTLYTEYRDALNLQNKIPEFIQKSGTTDTPLTLTLDADDLSDYKVLDGALTDYYKTGESKFWTEYTEEQIEYSTDLSNDEYTPCLKMSVGDTTFIAFPQNLSWISKCIDGNTQFRVEKLIVLVRLQFELNGNKHVYTRRYLPRYVVYDEDQKIYSLLEMRKQRKAADWKVDGVSYPVSQSELENLYRFYFNAVDEYHKEWRPDEQYRD